MSSVLVLGGTAWLGAMVARLALESGHDVTCLARGEAGEVPQGARLVRADRSSGTAYAPVSGRDWDAVIDLTWQPGFAAAALAALGERAAQWTYVSSISVYRDGELGQQHELAALLDPWQGNSATIAEYGAAKVACERSVTAVLGERALIVRPGLIGGPGDPSDRFGYWPAAFARAGTGPVLVPADRGALTQTIDVRDLAAWLVVCAVDGVVGVFNAVGASTPLEDVLDMAAASASYRGEVAEVSEAVLEENGVRPWAGPRSLPMWLPTADAWAFGATPGDAALHRGLALRPLSETVGDVLEDERSRGLDRPRRAGLTRTEEREVIDRIDNERH